MDTVFLDTSIFEANNFLEGKRIQEVYRLAEKGEILVVLPKLTYDEIINRISKNIDEASHRFKRFRDEVRILRNVPSLSKRFDPFEGPKIKEEFIGSLIKKFRESNFIIVDYPTINISGIFESYFEKKFPFGAAGKKSEFPDALALKSIELWAQENRSKVVVFSKDKDILRYKSECIEILEDFELYLSNKIKEIEGVRHRKRLEQIDNIIKNCSDGVKKEIRNWVESQLDDDSKYYDYSNYYDVHDISIKEIVININDYSITNISTDYISVELKVAVSYKVEIIIDDEDYMYKDEDTKDWVFLETKPVLVDEVRHIDVNLIFDIESDDVTVCDPEIEDINNGRKLNV